MNSDQKQTWLLVDATASAYSAFFSMGGLSHGDEGTGILFGMLKQYQILKEHFNPYGTIWCFDKGKTKRKNLFPEYKAKRPPKPVELMTQMKKLRDVYWPSIFGDNCFSQKGYEADDLIASICQSFIIPKSRKRSAVIVSGDEDFYQCIRFNLSVWHPKKKELVTEKVFQNRYGIEPIQWYTVKALAGCGTDEVPGVDGVGEKTAIRFIRGEIEENSHTYQKIKKFVESPNWKRNLALVKLPYKGCPTFKPIPDDPKIINKKITKLAETLGMKSLLRGGSYGGRPKYGWLD